MTVEEKRHVGILPSRQIMETAGKPLESLLSGFLDDLKAAGRSASYCVHVRRYVRSVVDFNGWRLVSHVNPLGFEKWRASVALSARSKNHYLAGCNAFLNWLCSHKCIAENPLSVVRKAEQKGRAVYTRLSYSECEIRGLLAVLPPMARAAVLLAYYCGLRYSEVKALRWDDVSLPDARIFLRASTTKNRKSACLPLHRDLVAALRAVMPADVSSSGEVIPHFRELRKKFPAYWALAGIAWESQKGYKDYHALRHSYCTNLERYGVPQRITQQLMRHSTITLSASVYTDVGRLDLRAGVDALPSVFPC